MKRTLAINQIIWALLFIATLITLIIVFNEVDHPYTFHFVIGYVVSLLLYALYFFTVIILKLRKLNWIAARKRVFRFSLMFVLFSAWGLLYNYFYKEAIDFLNIFSISFGISFGMSFFDLIFSNKKVDV